MSFLLDIVKMLLFFISVGISRRHFYGSPMFRTCEFTMDILLRMIILNMQTGHSYSVLVCYTYPVA